MQKKQLISSGRVMNMASSGVQRVQYGVGDVLTFGRYPQGANGEVKPIEWQVLRHDDNGVLMIAKCGLDSQPYNGRDCGVTWLQCGLRKWLNSEFVQRAFTAEERRLLQEVHLKNPPSHWDNTVPGGPDTEDKVFLLSHDEADLFLSSSSNWKCQPTAYVKRNGVCTRESDDSCYWWLRSPGLTDSDAAGASISGDVDYYGVAVNFVVRPVVKVDPAALIELAHSGQRRAEEHRAGALKQTSGAKVAKQLPAMQKATPQQEAKNRQATKQNRVATPKQAPKPQQATQPPQSSTQSHASAKSASTKPWAQYQVGDTFAFGRYPQGANGEVKPIEWQVLSRDADGLLVIAKYALDCKKYNEEWCGSTWSQCTLRKWLNGEFIREAFNEQELQQIKEVRIKNPSKLRSLCGFSSDGLDTDDKVFLLSHDEAEKLLASDDLRKCRATYYAKHNGAYTWDKNGMCRWWLRSPGFLTSRVAYVDGDGNVYFSYVHYDDFAVRPAFRIAL